MRVGIGGSYRSCIQNPLHICYDFEAALNLSFRLLPFGGRGVPRGSTIVLLSTWQGDGRLCFHRLSVQTAVVSVTVWPQFVMQVLSGERLVVGLETGPLSCVAR